jgi:hypothetical protein
MSSALHVTPRRVHGATDPHPFGIERVCQRDFGVAPRGEDGRRRPMFFAELMMAALLQPRGSSSCVSRTLAVARMRSQNSDHLTFRPGVRRCR